MKCDKFPKLYSMRLVVCPGICFVLGLMNIIVQYVYFVYMRCVCVYVCAKRGLGDGGAKG